MRLVGPILVHGVRTYAPKTDLKIRGAHIGPVYLPCIFKSVLATPMIWALSFMDFQNFGIFRIMRISTFI